MILLIKLFLKSKLDLIQTVKFVKQMFRIQIQNGGKLLLWNQVKSRMEACYSELVLVVHWLHIMRTVSKFDLNFYWISNSKIYENMTKFRGKNHVGFFNSDKCWKKGLPDKFK